MTDPKDRSPGGPTAGTSHPNTGPLGTGSNTGNRQDQTSRTATPGTGTPLPSTTPLTPNRTTGTPTTAGSSTQRTGDATGTGDTARKAREAAREGKETVRETAKEARDQIKGAAEEQMTEAKQVARRKAEELTDRGTRAASQRMEGFSRALRAAGKTLEEEGERKTGSGLHSLADQLERAQDYVGRQDFQGLVGDTERLARRNPELFLAGAYAAGILIGRFLRSSRPEPRDGSRTGGRHEPRPTSGRALPPAYGTGSLGGSPGVTP